MRKTMTLLAALALLVGFSGFAMAGGADGTCTYSDQKHQAKVEKVETEKTQPVASTTDQADTSVALANIEKTQPATSVKK